MDPIETAYLLNAGLLWLLMLLSAWNALNWVARAYYRKPKPGYGFSMFLGAWAALVLLLETL